MLTIREKTLKSLPERGQAVGGGKGGIPVRGGGIAAARQKNLLQLLRLPRAIPPAKSWQGSRG